MSALPSRSDIAGTPSNATAKSALAALFDFVAQRLAAGTSGAGTATLAELQTARESLGIVVPRGHIAGLTLSTAGSSATFSVAAGQAADDGAAVLVNLASSINKTTGSWAVGTGNGALDTGAIANNTWYHVWLIRRPDTGVVDVLVSTSASSPTMPANYTQRRRIGSMRTNGSAQWTKFYQLADQFLWDAPVLDVDITNEPTTATLRTLSVPTGLRVVALMNVRQTCAGASTECYFSSPDVSDQAASASVSPLSSITAAAGSGTPIVSAQIQTPTNASAQVRTRHSTGSASNSFRIATFGWIDARGAA